MTPGDREKLRKLIQRRVVLHKKAINGDFGEDKEHLNATFLLHESHEVESQINAMLTPEVVLNLLDVDADYVDMHYRLDEAQQEIEHLKKGTA